MASENRSSGDRNGIRHFQGIVHNIFIRNAIIVCLMRVLSVMFVVIWGWISYILPIYKGKQIITEVIFDIGPEFKPLKVMSDTLAPLWFYHWNIQAETWDICIFIDLDFHTVSLFRPKWNNFEKGGMDGKYHRKAARRGKCLLRDDDPGNSRFGSSPQGIANTSLKVLKANTFTESDKICRSDVNSESDAQLKIQ